MSKTGKGLLLFGSLFWVALYAFRLVYGGWHDSMWVPLGLGTVMIGAALIKDFRAIVDFLTMKTTKHGMNMGALILMTIAGLVCVNVLAVRYEKKFDWTSDKLNSLSDQSVKAAQALKADTEIVLLYRNDNQQNGEQISRSVKDIVDMYRNVSDKVKFSSYNALQRPDLAQKYEYTFGPFAVFAVQGAQKVKIDQPNEEGITRAFLKFGRGAKKVIYFVRGHGERNLEDKDDDGLSIFKEELEVTYDVKSMAIFEAGNKIPDDASVVAVVRPLQQFLEVELDAIRDYARRGGKVLLAIDPGSKQNMALLTKTFGVEFANDFILDLRSQVIQAGPATVLGTNFNPDSAITKAFPPSSFAIFHTASVLRRAPSLPESLSAQVLVSTDERTMAIPTMDQTQQVEYKPNGPHTIGMIVTGKLPAAPAQANARSTDKKAVADAKANSATTSASPAPTQEEPKEFSAIIFGDSDFLANRIIHNNLNKDLAMNSVAQLMEDKDLISIRPKEPKGTKLEMTNQGFMILLIGFLVPIPLLMFFTGGFFWWRRRTA